MLHALIKIILHLNKFKEKTVNCKLLKFQNDNF